MRTKRIHTRFMIVCLMAFVIGAAADEKVQIGELRKMMEQSQKFDRQRVCEYLKKEIPSGTLTEKDLIDLGFSCFRLRKWETGIELLKLVSQFFPQSAKAWSSLGDGYWTVGELPRALVCMEKGLSLAPENGEIKFNILLLKAEIYDEGHGTDQSFQFQEGEITGKTGPYLGQADPGPHPRIFAPGIVSTRGSNEFACTLSPDGRDFYFSRRAPGKENRIMVCRQTDKGWTAPAEACVNPGYANNEPHISHDGQTLYFGTVRPIPPDTPAGHFHTWTCKRTEQGWSTPTYFGPGMFVSTSDAGRVYTTDITGFAGGGLVVYEPRMEGGQSAPRPVFDWAKTWNGRQAHACIDWQERFLIFDSEIDTGLGGSDLFIVFRQEDGSWGQPEHMGEEINSPGHDYGAGLSPDGTFMFYSRHQDIYWINLHAFLKNRHNNKSER